jgi:uncharacterized protein (TIGR02145 family)
MKKLLFPLMAILIFAACEKQGISDNLSGKVGYISANGAAKKIVICHKGQAISINANAFAAHQAHGDVQGDCSSILTTTICNQTWMVKNLNVSTYRNGDPIPQVTDPTQWSSLTTGAWCYYNNDPANGDVYGKLYNWYAVTDPRGLAPLGWQVPSDEEWTILATCLGGQVVAGGKMKETGTVHWLSPNTGATNSSGFTALPGGFRFPGGDFILLGAGAEWWSSTEASEIENGITAWYRNIDYSGAYIGRTNGLKTQGFSVRCIRN